MECVWTSEKKRFYNYVKPFSNESKPDPMYTKTRWDPDKYITRMNPSNGMLWNFLIWTSINELQSFVFIVLYVNFYFILHSDTILFINIIKEREKNTFFLVNKLASTVGEPYWYWNTFFIFFLSNDNWISSLRILSKHLKMLETGKIKNERKYNQSVWTSPSFWLHFIVVVYPISFLLIFCIWAHFYYFLLFYSFYSLSIFVYSVNKKRISKRKRKQNNLVLSDFDINYTRKETHSFNGKKRWNVVFLFRSISIELENIVGCRDSFFSCVIIFGCQKQNVRKIE